MLGSVSIIVPTYREIDNLPFLIEQIEPIRTQFKALELIIVDDNSDDGTDAYLAGLSQYPWVRYILRKSERDLSTAVIAGFNAAQYSLLVCMDADLSHSPTIIPQLVQAISKPNVDFVIGSRFIAGGEIDKNWSWCRRLNALIAKLPAKLFTRVYDPMSGFFCVLSETFKKAAPLNPIGYKIGLELIVKCRCRNIVEIPIYFHDRLYGVSKLSFRQRLNYIKHIIRLLKFKLS